MEKMRGIQAVSLKKPHYNIPAAILQDSPSLDKFYCSLLHFAWSYAWTNVIKAIKANINVRMQILMCYNKASY